MVINMMKSDEFRRLLSLKGVCVPMKIYEHNTNYNTYKLCYIATERMPHGTKYHSMSRLWPSTVTAIK